MKRILGLDLGTRSIGYAIVHLKESGDAKKSFIQTAGVRLFSPAENVKDGSSLALPRRQARTLRRRLYRRVKRLKAIWTLLDDFNVIDSAAFDAIFETKPTDKTPWHLRYEGLNRVLNQYEWARVLYHLVKLRGFKSQRKSEETKKEGELLKSISDNEKLCQEKGYRTYAEMLVKENKQRDPFRNKSGDYKLAISRDLIENEARLLFETQRKLGSKHASIEMEKRFHDLAWYQEKISSFAHMVGNCRIFSDEKRAPQASYSYESFRAYQSFANITLIGMDENGRQKSGTLNADQVKKLIQKAHEVEDLKYSTIRSTLKVSKNIEFKGINKEKESKSVTKMSAYHDIRKAIEEIDKSYWVKINYNEPLLNQIATVLTYEKTDEKIKIELEKLSLPQSIIEKLTSISFSKFGHLSLKALQLLNVQFKVALDNDEVISYKVALQRAGLEEASEFRKVTSGSHLPIPEGGRFTNNPLVNRAMFQLRKVVNALIHEYGEDGKLPFDKVHVEFARDLANSKEKRTEIERAIDANRREKEKVDQELEELGFSPKKYKGLSTKYRLWKQQDEHCAYSCNKITLKDLTEEGKVELDHIVPFSRSFDDSLTNQVLCFADANRNKGNRTPAEWKGVNSSEWQRYCTQVQGWVNLPKAKKNRLLQEDFEAKEEVAKRRHLNDTRYIARMAREYLKESLFANSDKENVQVRAGQFTARVRHIWGIEKIREKGHKHHAVDAIVLACSDQKMVEELAIESQKENERELKRKHRFLLKTPWESFKSDVESVQKNIFCSRAPRRKVKGQGHQETIRSAKRLKDGLSTARTRLSDLKLKDLESLVDKDLHQDLYDQLKLHLEDFGGDGKKAFAEPFKWRRKDGTETIVRAVKLLTTQVSGVRVQKGIANNGDMVRLDVFERDKKFYLIPVYAHHFAKKIRPNRIMKAHKSEDEWPGLDDSYQFKFSLFKDDLVKIKKGDDEFIGYYAGCDRDGARIGLITHDAVDAKPTKRIGVQGLDKFIKYNVNILGSFSPIKRELRR